MNETSKTTIILLIFVIVAAGIVLVAASNTQKNNETASSIGNFTVQNTQQTDGSTFYSLMWHGENATIKIYSVQEQSFNLLKQKFAVYDGFATTIKTDSPVSIYAFNQKIMGLTP